MTPTNSSAQTAVTIMERPGVPPLTPGAQHNFFGLPKPLAIGLVGVLVFLAGDGMEAAFLSKYMVDLGLAENQAAQIFTVYGIVVALSSWLSAVLSEAWGPRRAMFIGLAVWLTGHVAFMMFGINTGDFLGMLVFYGIRGLGYPLFLYAFLVWISYVAERSKLSRANGIFWVAHSTGYGLLGSFLPSFLIPVIGYKNTLWLELAFVALGGLWFFAAVHKHRDLDVKNAVGGSSGESLKKAFMGLSVVKSHPRVAIAGAVRTINLIGFFAFPVFMPLVVTRAEIGFTITEWLQIWGTMSLACLVFNALFGILGDKIGWARQVRWFGCVGIAITTLLFYYAPFVVGANFWVMIVLAVLYAVTLCAFVPIGAIIPSLAPERKGAAMSVNNLCSGLSNFAGPAIVAVVAPFAGYDGVIWTIVGLFIVGAVLTYWLEDAQSMALQEETDPNSAFHAAISH
jgi:polyol permease family